METQKHDNSSILPAKNREPLPELILTELHKSEKPVYSKEGVDVGIETIHPWNNYTIITCKGKSEIVILDEYAKPLENFKPPLNQKEISIDWSKISSTEKFGKGKLYLCPETNNPGSDEIKPSAAPLELRKFVEKAMNKSSAQYLGVGGLSPLKFPPSQVTIIGDYIIFSSKENSLFAFETKNENGVILSPDNWKRINPIDKFPEGLNKHVKKLLNLPDGYKQLNQKYSVIITDVGINIVDSNDDKNIPLFSNIIPSVENNISADPTNPNIVYFCQSNNPQDIKQIDLNEDPSNWKIISAPLPEKYGSISNLQLDPSGNFFSFYSKEDFIIITKDTLEEVKRVPGLTNVNFDSSGHIRAIDKDGYLVILEPNFGDLIEEINKHKAASIAQSVKITDIFELQAAKKQEEVGIDLKHLEPLKIDYERQFTEVLTKINSPEEVMQLRQSFNRFENTLKQRGLKSNEIAYIISGLEGPIVLKEKEFAVKGAQETILSLREKLDSGLTISSISEARALITLVKAGESLLDDNIRIQFKETAHEFEKKTLEFFHQRGNEVTKDVDAMLERTKADLDSFTSKSQMDNWLEFQFPKFKTLLSTLASDIPIEADEAYKKVIAVREQLQELATKNEEKFKKEYAKVREKAADRTEATVDNLIEDTNSLLERLKDKGFTDRKSAEQYLSSSEARKAIENEIAGLSGSNPDLAKELIKGLKVKISNTLTEIERGSLTQVVETGQQMILFGNTLFPKWEAKVKEKLDRKVDLIFEEDSKTHGPGVSSKDIFGDLSLSIRSSTGKIEKVRLYEGWQDENEWRLGLSTILGNPIPPSYLSAQKFRDIKIKYNDWSQGDSSGLKKELQSKRNELKDLYATRQKVEERTEDKDNAWKNEFNQKITAYSAFISDNYIPILKRIDQVKSEPEIEYTNGKGFVPTWQSHWVVDPQTEKDLEGMANALKMQLDLQEGLLNLKGHAGTGKDVRLKMFCSMTNRPYFAIDGTKWTTEFELSEDVMLESKDGASQTVKVPSAVLSGITTPGAVVYFNEFNAMPEQAQIFLHALMDEKRSLTLKTSSGKTIHADPSVLLVASMNPNYPGTFVPQFATRSRMLSLEIDYPPLTRKADAEDPNQNPLYDSSEALRMARGIDSLDDLTYEANLEHNDFVKLWDHYINGVDNGSPEPTLIQKFDLDTSLAVIQFSQKLRADFIKIFEKSRDVRDALPVSQPITGRELRRMAYVLSKMTPEEKAKANPETVARELLERFFLTHIDKKEDRDKIRTAINTWTSQKRVMK